MRRLRHGPPAAGRMGMTRLPANPFTPTPAEREAAMVAASEAAQTQENDQ